MKHYREIQVKGKWDVCLFAIADGSGPQFRGSLRQFNISVVREVCSCDRPHWSDLFSKLLLGL